MYITHINDTQWDVTRYKKRIIKKKGWRWIYNISFRRGTQTWLLWTR